MRELVEKTALTLGQLQAAHFERQEEWCPDQKPDLSFRGNEMAGEVGEACNVIKKLERERHGWSGSRATKEQLAEELADVVHTAILCAITAGTHLEPAVIDKFNSTSEKNGLASRIRSCLLDKPEAVESVGYAYAPEMQSGKDGFWVSREQSNAYDTPLYAAHTPADTDAGSARSGHDALIGNLLDRWEMTPNDLKEEMREHGCGKQLDALLANPTPADTDAAQSGAEAFDTIVAARKAYVDAVAAYNARLEFVRAERERGKWLNVDPEYAAMSEAQSAFYRTVQHLADAAIRQRAEEKP
ncbi:MazG-like family protein [Sinorhizobium medicae]|nr:MazG-like family protein [Sinorhizobium medicae]